MSTVVQEVRNYVLQNQLEPALAKLRSVFSLADSVLVNDVIILTGQLKKLQSDTRKGILAYQEENIRHNKIMNAILSLVDEIKKDPDSFQAYEQTTHQLDQSLKEKGEVELPAGKKDALFERLTYIKEKGRSIKMLWIDDQPKAIAYERKVIASIGINIDTVDSSAAAAQRLDATAYDIVVSDVVRAQDMEEGLRFHRARVRQGEDIPTIFYVSNLDRSKGVPPYAFGITNLPNELFHLVLDVVERIGP